MPLMNNAQQSIGNWRNKIHSNKTECEARNKHLRSEKESLQGHFQVLKLGRMLQR